MTDSGKTTPRRTLVLCAVGALAGLALAGYGLFTAQGTHTAHVPAEDAAVVNGVPILREDLVQQVTSLYGISLSAATPAQRRKALADMIHEELVVQRGVEMGLVTDDTDVRSALVTGMEGQIAQDANATAASDAQMRAWYDAHRDAYAGEGSMVVREWILPRDVGDASAIAAALRADRSPESLHLQENGRTNDGWEFYFAARLHLGPRIFAVARSLRDGQVSDPIADGDGLHIVRMVANRPPVPVAFEAARPRILEDIREARRRTAEAENAGFLWRRADIRIAGDLQ